MKELSGLIVIPPPAPTDETRKQRIDLDDDTFVEVGYSGPGTCRVSVLVTLDLPKKTCEACGLPFLDGECFGTRPLSQGKEWHAFESDCIERLKAELAAEKAPDIL